MAEQEVVVKFRGDIRDLQRRMDAIERDGAQTARSIERSFTTSSNRIERAFRAIRGPALVATAAGGCVRRACAALAGCNGKHG